MKWINIRGLIPMTLHTELKIYMARSKKLLPLILIEALKEYLRKHNK